MTRLQTPWFSVPDDAQFFVAPVTAASAVRGVKPTAPTTAATASNAASQPNFETFNVSSW